MIHGGFTDPEIRDHFGTCPDCGQTDGFVNIERDHYFFCDAHRTCWYVGSNLFSCWKDEDEAVWQSNREHLRDYRSC